MTCMDLNVCVCTHVCMLTPPLRVDLICNYPYIKKNKLCRATIAEKLVEHPFCLFLVTLQCQVMNVIFNIIEERS